MHFSLNRPNPVTGEKGEIIYCFTIFSNLSIVFIVRVIREETHKYMVASALHTCTKFISLGLHFLFTVNHIDYGNHCFEYKGLYVVVPYVLWRKFPTIAASTFTRI